MNGRVVHSDRSPHSAIPRMFYFNSSRLRDPRRKYCASTRCSASDLRHIWNGLCRIEKFLTRERGRMVGRQTDSALPTAATVSRISREIKRNVNRVCLVGASEN